MKKNYSELLKDPRWQKKRLEILQRDNFKCMSCGETKDTLHVHHIRYEYGNNPWDATDKDLITLCEACHTAWHYLYDSKFDPSLISLVVALWDKMDAEMVYEFFNSHNNE